MLNLVNFLIVALLAVLVVLEILRPRRLRSLLDEVDQRTEAATEALDEAQRRLDQAVQELAAQHNRQEAGAADRAPRETEPSPGRRRASAAARYRREAEGRPAPDKEQGPDPDEEVRSLRRKLAEQLERSTSDRSPRERRLLGELQGILDMESGPERETQEKSLYEALQRAMEEPAARKPTAVPDEEHRLIEKLRGNT
ncbi:MAG TPA: hypothetical protein VKA48_07150 [Gammaproteobacteria bacterium]|nr:hypothetical protein [Gammaproteobacteria bacterium]